MRFFISHCRLSLPNLSYVSIPTEETNEEMKENLRKKIKDGAYNIGYMIVPQKYQRTVLNGDKIEKEIVEISGRKINILDVRKTILKRNEKFMRIFTDEQYEKMSSTELMNEFRRIHEFSQYNTNMSKKDIIIKLKHLQRTRHLMCWHDGATLAGHGYILMTFSELYNPAIHYRDHEFLAKFKKDIHVQPHIEKPVLYLIARCSATDQQLLYSSLRLTDIFELKEELSTSSGLILTDKLRFFKGDSPARQFEAGQKKGGNNFCCSCPINGQYAGKYTYVYNLPILSLQDRVNKIIQTTASLSKLNQNKTNLYDKMKKHEIVEELRQRNVKFLSILPAKELQSFFDFEMHGIQRLPALLFGQCNFNLQSLHLDSYEILTHEPLHDFMNYIKNLYEELPLHLPKEKKEKLRDIINSSFNAKEAKNGSDY